MLLFLLRTCANAVTIFPPYFVCTTSEGSGEIAQMSSLGFQVFQVFIQDKTPSRGICQTTTYTHVKNT